MAQHVEDLIGDAVYDVGGDKIGKVKRVYVDNASGAPTWASVSTGFFRDDSLVPLAGAQLYQDTGELQVRVHKDAVKAAPHLEHDGLISRESEDELFVHYGLDPGPGAEAYGRHAEQTDPGTTATAGTAAAGGAVAGGMAVPTSHEEVHIERELVTDPTAVDADLGDEAQEVTLHEERTTVHKETVSGAGRKERIETEGIDRDDDRR
ncbi:PRC-barrel domain-containing protein [Nocardia sp. NPDC051750]|uniref:PRC-barrel domain-containing protein n=1 Tax=Nocardia sp. NPDC051750 TaxID=3364325 RepID=UPI00379CDC51